MPGGAVVVPLFLGLVRARAAPLKFVLFTSVACLMICWFTRSCRFCSLFRPVGVQYFEVAGELSNFPLKVRHNHIYVRSRRWKHGTIRFASNGNIISRSASTGSASRVAQAVTVLLVKMESRGANRRRCADPSFLMGGTRCAIRYANCAEKLVRVWTAALACAFRSTSMAQASRAQHRCEDRISSFASTTHVRRSDST